MCALIWNPSWRHSTMFLHCVLTGYLYIAKQIDVPISGTKFSFNTMIHSGTSNAFEFSPGVFARLNNYPTHW